MKAKVLEIRWHDTQPIYSADFHQVKPDGYKRIANPYMRLSSSNVPAGSGAGAGASAAGAEEDDQVWRLATAGGDRFVRLWLVHPRPPKPVAPITIGPSSSSGGSGGASTSSSAPSFKLKASVHQAMEAQPWDGSPKVEYLATLRQHTGVVNVVRFSPAGDMLASAGDDGNILFWVPGEGSSTFGDSAEDREYEREHWRVKSMVRSKSGQEIYDLAWSPDGRFILAGSIDHTASIYDVATGSLVHTIAEHTNYVQGVAWDPTNNFIATQSSDRTMHIYSVRPKDVGIEVHPVGKNTRMELFQKVDVWQDEAVRRSRHRRREERPHVSRSVSHASDSERSEASSSVPSTRPPMEPSESATSVFSSKDDERAMDPPPTTSATTPTIPPRGTSLSRRSSISGSQSGMSPRAFRSPSPAPLPAIKPAAVASPRASPSPSDALFGEPKTFRLYVDPTATPFFRRLAWSTDGSLLLTPAGLFEDPFYGTAAQAKRGNHTGDGMEAAGASSSSGGGGGKKKRTASGGDAPSAEASSTAVAGSKGPQPTVYIYSRGNLERPPVAHLPGHRTTSLAIRFCPVLWKLRKTRRPGEEDDEELVKVNLERGQEVSVSLTVAPEDEEQDDKATETSGAPKTETDGGNSGDADSVFALPYRMVYAVATLDAVYLYDTQQAGPICLFANLHYAPFTDVAWSADGLTLAISSQDGYCSIVAFQPGELGKPYDSAPVTAPSVIHSSAPSASASASAPVPSPSLSVPGSSDPMAAAATTKPMARSTSNDGSATSDSGEPAKKKRKIPLNFHGPVGGAAAAAAATASNTTAPAASGGTSPAGTAQSPLPSASSS